MPNINNSYSDPIKKMIGNFNEEGTAKLTKADVVFLQTLKKGLKQGICSDKFHDNLQILKKKTGEVRNIQPPSKKGLYIRFDALCKKISSLYTKFFPNTLEAKAKELIHEVARDSAQNLSTPQFHKLAKNILMEELSKKDPKAEKNLEDALGRLYTVDLKNPKKAAEEIFSALKFGLVNPNRKEEVLENFIVEKVLTDLPSDIATSILNKLEKTQIPKSLEKACDLKDAIEQGDSSYVLAKFIQDNQALRIPEKLSTLIENVAKGKIDESSFKIGKDLLQDPESKISELAHSILRNSSSFSQQLLEEMQKDPNSIETNLRILLKQNENTLTPLRSKLSPIVAKQKAEIETKKNPSTPQETDTTLKTSSQESDEDFLSVEVPDHSEKDLALCNSYLTKESLNFTNNIKNILSKSQLKKLSDADVNNLIANASALLNNMASNPENKDSCIKTLTDVQNFILQLPKKNKPAQKFFQSLLNKATSETQKQVCGHLLCLQEIPDLIVLNPNKVIPLLSSLKIDNEDDLKPIEAYVNAMLDIMKVENNHPEGMKDPFYSSPKLRPLLTELLNKHGFSSTSTIQERISNIASPEIKEKKSIYKEEDAAYAQDKRLNSDENSFILEKMKKSYLEGSKETQKKMQNDATFSSLLASEIIQANKALKANDPNNAVDRKIILEKSVKTALILTSQKNFKEVDLHSMYDSLVNITAAASKEEITLPEEDQMLTDFTLSYMRKNPSFNTPKPDKSKS